MKLNCIVVDDDPVFRVMLKELIKQYGDRLNLVGIAESAEEAQPVFKNHDVDIIFLDLGLPGMDGFEFLESLGNPEDVEIILVTGHKQYALDAFEYDVLDYLVKPISKERFEKAVSKAERAKSVGANAVTKESRIFNKLARFMHSRDMKKIEPVPMRASKLGYAYPMLSANFNLENEQNALDILEEAEEEGLMNGEFVDSMYVCNTCYNSQLQFRETCSNCHSSNLEAEDLVHHFSCAYMGPISDFHEKSDDKSLVCPKCEKTLDHIGVDYDKPSVVYNCRKCDQSFQNPHIRAKCQNCGSDTRVEHLIKKNIKTYALTQAGMQIGTGNLKANLRNDSALNDIMDEDYFWRSLQKAIERKKRHGERGYLAQMVFTNISELYERIGEERTEELIQELHQVITQELSATDDAIFFSRVNARLLFTDMKENEAKKTVKDIARTLLELIHDNYEKFELQISSILQPVDKNNTVKQQLRNLSEPTDQG